ncbi:MAG: histidine kinase [Rhodothermales bacterium]
MSRSSSRSWPDHVKPVWPANRLALLWVVSFGIVTVLILADVGQDYMIRRMRFGSDETFLDLLKWPAVLWYGWALLAPPIFLLSLKYPLDRGLWPRHLPILLAGLVGAYVLHVSIQLASMLLPVFSHIHSGWRDALSFHTITSVYLSLMMYSIMVGIAHAYRYYQQYRRRELTAARLESELVRAQLQALRMQLHPHFLFNTLNGIATLMHRDPMAADRMLTRLSGLLRLALDSSDTPEVPLIEETSFLEQYLELEQIRFDGRMTVTFAIDPDTEDALVPNLILQPLVENAVKHAIAPRVEAGHVRIASWRENGSLRLRVSDTGPGLTGSAEEPASGTGLANTRDRLRKLYGAAQSMRLSNAAPSGLVVDLTIPFRRLADT